MRYIIFFALAIVSFDSFACTCVGKHNFEESFKKADQVYLGRIIDSSHVTFYSFDKLVSIKLVVYNVEVIEVYKNNGLRSNVVQIISEYYEGDCGVNFNLNEEYFIFGEPTTELYTLAQTKKSKKYITDICSGTEAFNTLTYDLLKIKTKHR